MGFYGWFITTGSRLKGTPFSASKFSTLFFFIISYCTFIFLFPVPGTSVTSIVSEGTTTTAGISTPPSSSPSLLCGNSRGSSITAISSPLSNGSHSNGTPAGQTTPVTTTTTTPSISPAPSTSSLATSSTSSSNLGLHQHHPTSTASGGRVYGGSATTGNVSTGVAGLRALRDRGDLVFRAPAAVGGVSGATRRVRVNNQGVSGGGEYQPR